MDIQYDFESMGHRHNSFYKTIQFQNWQFPIDTPNNNGPAAYSNIAYTDVEALLASQYNLGMGMQASSIGDLVNYAGQGSPSTLSNWAVHFREFPTVPVHHLQTANPGNPTRAAQFSITQINVIGGVATVSCSGSIPGSDCSVFCNDLPWVYISGASVPVFNGIQQTLTSGPPNGCASGTVQLTGNFSGVPSAGNQGYIYSAAHLPPLLPFESQQCRGSFATICSAELWEESLDCAYGTNTVSNTAGNAPSGDPAYQAAISNFLAGLPSANSLHNHMSANHANHY